MPKFGVYRFVSDKVVANSSKQKFHIAIKFGVKSKFLFINSNAFEGDMAIDRTDWPEMPKTESFICFTGMINYDVAELKEIGVFEKCGEISEECIAKIRAHALESLVMEQWQIDFLVAEIDSIER